MINFPTRFTADMRIDSEIIIKIQFGEQEIFSLLSRSISEHPGSISCEQKSFIQFERSFWRSRRLRYRGFDCENCETTGCAELTIGWPNKIVPWWVQLSVLGIFDLCGHRDKGGRISGWQLEYIHVISYGSFHTCSGFAEKSSHSLSHPFADKTVITFSHTITQNFFLRKKLTHGQRMLINKCWLSINLAWYRGSALNRGTQLIGLEIMKGVVAWCNEYDYI